MHEGPEDHHDLAEPRPKKSVFDVVHHQRIDDVEICPDPRAQRRLTRPGDRACRAYLVGVRKGRHLLMVDTGPLWQTNEDCDGEQR